MTCSINFPSHLIFLSSVVMKRSPSELASVISRALISASNQTAPTRTWTPSLEHTLLKLRCRESLSPALVARVIDPYLINHHSLALGFFNWASQQPGFIHTSFTYQSILKSLSIARQFNAVLKLLKQVKSLKVPLHPSIYRSVIVSQIVGKKTHVAFSIFNEVSHLLPEIGPEICNLLLAALSSDENINISCAQTVFGEMIRRGITLSTLGFGVFIWRFCKIHVLGEVLCMLDKVREIDFSNINGSVIAVLVVQGLCLTDSRVTSEAIDALDELRIRDCKPDFMAYRIVAEALRRMGCMVEVEMVLKKKRKLGVSPRANDYRKLILDLISERLITEAKDLGEVIIQGNFPIEDDVLNALIGSVSNTHPHCAVSFFKFMIGKERFPTLLTLINLSRNLCRHGMTAELVAVFKDLRDGEYFIDIEGYNVMISFLCKAGEVKEAYQVLQEMKKKGVGPDVSSYNSLLEACCREDLLRPAKRLWDEMFANGCAGNLKTYNILIRRFSEVGQIEEAQRLFHHMVENGVAPDAMTYESLLGGLCQTNELETAIQLFNRSIVQDITVAEAILSTFILSLCRKGYFHAASKLLRDHAADMRYLQSHITLLKFLADAGEISLIAEHTKWIGDESSLMSGILQNEVIASLPEARKLLPIQKI